MDDTLTRPQAAAVQGAILMNNLVLVFARFVPAKLCAWFTERYLSAEATLAISQKLPPQKSAAIVNYLSSEYLLQLIPMLDPLASQKLLAEISPAAVARIAKILVDQREFGSISRLVGYLSPAAMMQAMGAFHSASDLLNVALQVEDKLLLSPAVAALPAQRLSGLLIAAEKAGQWPELFHIIEVMDAPTRHQLGERLAELPSHSMRGLLNASLALNAWPKLLQICLSLSQHAQEQLALNIAQQDEALHLKFMQAARQQGEMQTLLKLVGHMPIADQRRLVRMAGRNGIRITSVL